MNKQDLLNKLNRRDLPGVGCVVYHTDGRKTYNFYEDFSSADMGIARAERQFTDLIEKGYVRRVEYIHKDYSTIHFWDWNAKPGTFCAADEYRYFNKCMGIDYFTDHLSRFISIINGLQYKYDYTPAIDGISAIAAVRANQ